MDVRLDGRSAIITGGSAGIGKAIALEYARSGANVAIVARRQETLDSALAEIQAAAPKVKAIAVSTSVASAEGCKQAFAAAESAFGQVDILVNNAGTSQRGAFLEISDELWQDDLELKLFGAIRLCRLVMPGMQSRRWGRIINVLNIGAKAPNPEGAPTAVSRAAGMALTKVLAGEGAPHNVLVNGLLVGKIESDQWVRRHAASGSNDSLESYYAQLGKSVPLGRYGKAEEFAALATLLASDNCGYVTGTAINVDGGLSPVV
ncbi:MAG: SDR family oxidoreductase [Gammaproteobacteria bacterium]|nr:SDR family oxidoreductase [Gammaproteobacteria bacterium]